VTATPPVSDLDGANSRDQPALWSAFAVYTASRLGLFAVLFLLFYLAGLRGLVVLLLPLLLSGAASYFLLARQRDAFATALAARATKRTPRVSARTAREDAIADALAEQNTRDPG
jgi:hypothetical protein